MSAVDPILEHNRRAWDARVRGRERFTQPAEDDRFRDPLAAIHADGWLAGGVAGKRVLCLAAGGGKHGPLYAAAGAVVTVVDISAAMLELDRQVAAERGLSLRTIETSMDDLAAFATGEFDVVTQPVSTCYVRDVAAVYRQVARVTAAGGLYISQHKQPVSLQAGETPAASGRYELVEPCDTREPLREVAASRHREEGTLEFAHGWESLVGHLCRAGFVLEDLMEPPHADASAPVGSFGHRCRYAPPYVRLKARRTHAKGATIEPPKLWTPNDSSD